MLNTMLGIKKGMTSTYDARGRRVGATVVQLGPNFVTQVKTVHSKDKYNSLQIGYGSKKSVKKPQRGLFKKVGVAENLRWLREVKIKDPGFKFEDIQLGQEIKLEKIFKVGDIVKITATSKGKGFQGGVRRWGFHGGPKTHGQSDRHRAPGSIGAGTTPGRVYKGKKMAGHMGSETVSYKNLEVLALNGEENLITIKGGVPGANEGLVLVQRIGVVRGYTPPPEPEPEPEPEEEELSDEKQEISKSEENTENETEQVKENVEEAIK